MLPIIIVALTLVISAIAVYTDVRWGRILNAVTVPAMGLGVVLNTVLYGLDGLLLSAEGLLLGFALFLLSASFGRLLGGGDIKLLMAVGALHGPYFLAWALLYTVLIGAGLALLVALYRGVLGRRMRMLGASLYLRLTQGVPMEMHEATTGPRLPYAIAITLGTLVTLWLLHTW